jgi:exodeoxyribonuclease X
VSQKIRVVDLETIFEEPQENGIVEIGYTDVIAGNRDLLGDPIDWYVGETWSTLVNPKQPITPETSAIHHIVDLDVQKCLPWNEVWPLVFRGDEAEGVIAHAAHGAKFERAWLSEELTGGKPWIDTFRCALWLHPDSPSHSNQCLRYYLRPEGLDRRKADPTHRAGPDSYVTAFHVRDFLNAGNSVQKLVDWTNSPALTPRCKIGDTYRNGGKGTPWTEVESSMLSWILSKDFDEDVMFTARYHLEQREIDQRIEREKRELERQFAQNGMSTNPLQSDPSNRPFAPIESY